VLGHELQVDIINSPFLLHVVISRKWLKQIVATEYY